jgi:hypothetical protein
MVESRWGRLDRHAEDLEQISEGAHRARVSGLRNRDGFRVATEEGQPGWRSPDRPAKERLGSKGRPHGKHTPR